MEELQRFLKDQQTGLIDSSGEFTIAADKALEKLAHSQLPHPSYWILKIVQFASAFGVEVVNVRVSRRVWRIDMKIPSPLAVYQLQKGLDSVEPLKDPALDHLVTGLRALGGVEGRRFALTLVGLDGTEYLLWNGEKLSSRREQVESQDSHLALEITSSSPHLWGKLVDIVSVENRAAEASLLTEKAFTVPLALKVDGRHPNFSHFEKPKWFSQPLVWDFASHEDGCRLPFIFLHQLRTSVVGRARTLAKTEIEQGRSKVSAFWCITYNYQLEHKILRLNPTPTPQGANSYLHWIKDGVIVKTETLLGRKGGFALELFVDARDCPADLGGLNLRRSETFLNKRQWVENLLEHITKSAVEQVREGKKLWGRVLGGWDTLVATTSYLPLTGTVTYQKPGMVGTTLNSLPGFRKSLLKTIKSHHLDFTDLKLPKY